MKGLTTLLFIGFILAVVVSDQSSQGQYEGPVPQLRVDTRTKRVRIYVGGKNIIFLRIFRIFGSNVTDRQLESHQ